MIATTQAIEVAATPAQVWAVLGRFMHIDEFHPRVSKVDALTDARTGLGASRRCHFRDGTSAVEKVVDWQDGSTYQVQLSEFSMPLKHLSMRFVVEPLGDRARVTMRLDFEVKFGPLGWVMGKTMMSTMMGKMMRMVLGGLEDRVQQTVRAPAAAA